MRNINIDRLPITLLLALSIILPSSNVLGINYKAILLIALTAQIFKKLLKSKLNRLSLMQLYFSLAFVIIFTFVARVNDIDFKSTISQAAAFGDAFAILWLTIALVKYGVVEIKHVIYTIIYSSAAASITKILMYGALMAGYPLTALKLDILQIFEINLVGMHVGDFYRVSFVSDNLLPAILFTLLAGSSIQINIGPMRRLFIIFLTLASIAISYSRYLWFAALFAAVLQILFLIKSKNYIKIILFVMVSVVFVAVIYFNINFIINRYIGNNADASDLTRFIMLHALIERFYSYPILGAGLGAATPGFINIAAVPWYYELQWLAFVMQFGVIGSLFLLVSSTYWIGLRLYLSLNVNLIGLATMYILWLGTAVFNGFMLTGVGGVIFLYFYLISELNRESKKNAIA